MQPGGEGHPEGRNRGDICRGQWGTAKGVCRRISPDQKARKRRKQGLDRERRHHALIGDSLH